MNFNLFDDMDGLILRERENNLSRQNNFVGSSPAMNGTGSNSSGVYDGNVSGFPSQTPLAMAYVPFQQWGRVYSEDDALDNGTLFPELVFPFERGGSRGE